ncbi:MAG: hypothetical protein CMJ87_13200 [Planctomycetes bacterium]|jgi:YHS domain-containing protein|nr:hypothetical protein [Planctomycetota bacterium]
MKTVVWLTAVLVSAAALPASSASLAPARWALVAQENATPAPTDEEVPISFSTPPAVGTKARCATTKKVFTVVAETTRSEYEGQHHVFCCPGCRSSFDADPEKYIEKAE